MDVICRTLKLKTGLEGSSRGPQRVIPSLNNCARRVIRAFNVKIVRIHERTAVCHLQDGSVEFPDRCRHRSSHAPDPAPIAFKIDGSGQLLIGEERRA
mgnify:CR=1 FL=1|jgi:hypothetical protein